MSEMKNKSYKDVIMNSSIAVAILGVLAILFGIAFVFLGPDNTPITRQEAVAYSGSLDHYSSSKFCDIYFEDGSVYSIHSDTEKSEFREEMKSLKKGTRIHILVNPNNDYVVEVRANGKNLLDFEKSQKAIADSERWGIVLGVIVCLAGAFLIYYAIALKRHKQKQENQPAKEVSGSINTGILRTADETVKGRVLLEAEVQGYQICYRRVRFVNELVVNGAVYDEIKAFIEFPHKLCANLGGHTIEAGYDDDSNSYIMFDQEIIKQKKRIV